MSHWTQGPARWVAAVTLGAASIAGLAWSMTSRRPVEPAPVVEPVGRAIESRGQATRSPVHLPERKIGTLIDLNTASAAALEMLPGIGPTLAQRIVEDRERGGAFASVDDLQRVRGIGPRTVEKIAPMATVER